MTQIPVFIQATFPFTHHTPTQVKFNVTIVRELDRISHHHHRHRHSSADKTEFKNWNGIFNGWNRRSKLFKVSFPHSTPLMKYTQKAYLTMTRPPTTVTQQMGGGESGVDMNRLMKTMAMREEESKTPYTNQLMQMKDDLDQLMKYTSIPVSEKLNMIKDKLMVYRRLMKKSRTLRGTPPVRYVDGRSNYSGHHHYSCHGQTVENSSTPSGGGCRTSPAV